MGRINTKRPKVYFFCALTYSKQEYYQKALNQLQKKWGNVLCESEEYLFSRITAYYQKEMGMNLKKKIVFFEQAVEIDRLHLSKVWTNDFEDQNVINGIREINLDPGYLTEAKVVLFSTKDFSHRIFIGDGIFAEITLSFKAKEGFISLPWTFPDYQIQEHLNFFNLVRDSYRRFLGK